MRGMKEFKEGRGPRPTLVNATGTERRIHTLLVTEEEAQTPDQIIKALSLEDTEDATAEQVVARAMEDLQRAGLVRGDAGGGYTGVAP